MKTLLVLFCFIMCCVPVCAGQTCVLDGRIANKGQPLPGAVITIFAGVEKAQVQAVALAGDDGFFCLEKIPAGSYRMRVSSVGYRLYETVIAIRQHPVHMGAIALSVADSVLDEVVVSAKLLPVVQRHDTTEYAAGAYKISEHASAVTLIRKLPGITAAGNSIKAHGEEITNILVDGKPFFTGDPYAALATLPAGMIDKVQVYHERQPGKEPGGFDDKPLPVINLVIKENRKHSIFGNAYAGAGTGSRYLSGITANTFSGDRRASVILGSDNIHAQHYTADQLPGTADNTMLRTQQASLNYTDKWKKLELAATYHYVRNTAEQETRQLRSYTQVADAALTYRGADKRTAVTDGHNLALTLNYHADSFNSLQVRPQWARQQNKTVADMAGIMYRYGQETGGARAHNDAAIFTASLGADVLYTHKWRQAGRALTLGAGYKQDDNSATLMQAIQDDILTDSSQLRTGTHLSEKTATASAAYAMPLGNAGQVQLQYELTNRIATSYKESFTSADPQQAGGTPQTETFNEFTATSLVQKAAALYRLRKAAADISVGVSAQHAQQQLSQQQPYSFSAGRTYQDLLPVLSAQYYFTEAKNLQLTYIANAGLPEITQLQPVADNTNPMLLYMGNAGLKQVCQHNLSVRYSANNAARQINYFMLLSGSYARNYISNSIFFADHDTLIAPGVLMRSGAQLLQPVNIDGYSYLNFTAGYGFPLWKLNIDANLTGNMVHVPVMMNGVVSKIARSGAGADFTVSSNISSSIDITVSGSNMFHFITGAPAGGNVYYNGSGNLIGNLHLPAGFTINTSIAYRLTKAPGAGNSNDMLLCNLGVGKQLWKERAQVRLLLYDCLRQNKNISQYVTDTYTEQVWRNAMERYVLLVLNCNFHRYR